MSFGCAACGHKSESRCGHQELLLQLEALKAGSLKDLAESNAVWEKKWEASELQVGALARALADIHREVVIHDLSPNTPKVVRTLASEAIAALAKAGFSVESALTRDGLAPDGTYKGDGLSPGAQHPVKLSEQGVAPRSGFDGMATIKPEEEGPLPDIPIYIDGQEVLERPSFETAEDFAVFLARIAEGRDFCVVVDHPHDEDSEVVEVTIGSQGDRQPWKCPHGCDDL